MTKRAGGAPDSGPWKAGRWRGQHGSVALFSDDFTHDVALIINGDFGSHESRLAYGRRMARWMNDALGAKPPPARKKER